MNPELIDAGIAAGLFAVGSAVLVWLSRKPLRNPGGHGFYRFFAWEAILLLCVHNRHPWGEQPFSAHQTASWLLMLLSIALVWLGARALNSDGRADRQRQDAGLYDFERTTALVESGIFRYLRHPMYASLLALTWAAFLQAPDEVGATVALVGSVFLLLTARADERECLEYFGGEYADYMRRSWRFIPFFY